MYIFVLSHIKLNVNKHMLLEMGFKTNALKKFVNCKCFLKVMFFSYIIYIIDLNNDVLLEI